jgi:AraC family transcriptional regulator
MVVQSELEKSDLHPVNISLGEALIEEKEVSTEQLKKLSERLNAVGFELIDEKTFIIDTVHYNDEQPKTNYSSLLSQHLQRDYSYLSNLFSQAEGITIEQYIINHKIEKVKELLLYDELSLSQIALQMGYSSTAHLSAKFKKVTGLTASKFKEMGMQSRKALDELGKPK